MSTEKQDTPAKKARKKLGMTIYEVAGKSGLSAASVSRIENGKQECSGDSAERLAKTLGLREEEILYPERFASPF